MTEQAAAKALVSLSRGRKSPSDEEGEVEDGPRRKRVKDSVDGSAPSLARRRSARTKVSTREPAPQDKDDDADAGNKRRMKGSQRDILLAESRAESLSRSSSRAAFHMDRYGRSYYGYEKNKHKATAAAS